MPRENIPIDDISKSPPNKLSLPKCTNHPIEAFKVSYFFASLFSVRSAMIDPHHATKLTRAVSNASCAETKNDSYGFSKAKHARIHQLHVY